MSLLGKEDMIEVPTLVKDPSSGKKTIGRVVYSYDPASGLVIREAKDFSQLYSGGRGAVTQQLRNVENMRFSYYFYNERELISRFPERSVTCRFFYQRYRP